MSARIPHLLTRLMSSDDLDALRDEYLARASDSTGPACETWLDAVIILDRHQEQSFERRSKATPSARRKSLCLRHAR